MYLKLRGMFSRFEEQHPAELLERNDEDDYYDDYANEAENRFGKEEYNQMKMS